MTEATAVATTPVPGSSRGRWLIALGVAGAAVALTIVAVLVLGGRQAPEALRYLPADAIMVAELRLDLPGDQLQKVGNLLAHFPGFADQSTLAQKLDEAGDRLVGMISNGEISYTGDLKPWVSGPVFAALRGIEPGPRLDPRPSWLLVATTNGAVGCDELFDGRTTTSETYRELTIRVADGGAEACVEDDRYVVAGDLESVKAGLDAQVDGDGVGESERYQTARAALTGDQLGTLFVSGDALERLGDLSAIVGGPTMPFEADLPDWSIMGVRAEDDALIVDSVSSPLPEPSAAPSLLSLPPGHPSELTGHVPGSAIAYAEVQGAGASIVNALTMLRTEPTLAEPLAELDQILTAFGGAETLLGWVSDAGVVIVADENAEAGGISGGVLLLAPDEATAEARLATYQSLLALAVLGGAAELSTTTIGGVEVTTVTVSQAAGLPVAEPIEFSFGRSGRLVVIGSSAAFVGRIFGQGEAGSLALDERFARAAGHGVGDPGSLYYVSVQGLVEVGRVMLPPEELARFEADVQPYLASIEAIHMSATAGPAGSRARIVMTVTQPDEP